MDVLLTDGFAGTVKLHLIAFERVRERVRERAKENEAQKQKLDTKSDMIIGEREK